jgi:hypothetical protein
MLRLLARLTLVENVFGHLRTFASAPLRPSAWRWPPSLPSNRSSNFDSPIPARRTSRPHHLSGRVNWGKEPPFVDSIHRPVRDADAIDSMTWQRGPSHALRSLSAPPSYFGNPSSCFGNVALPAYSPSRCDPTLSTSATTASGQIICFAASRMRWLSRRHGLMSSLDRLYSAIPRGGSCLRKKTESQMWPRCWLCYVVEG